MTQTRFPNRLNAVAFANLVRALAEGEHTIVGLMEETGLSRLTLYRYTRAMYDAGQIHISAWGRDKRGRVMMKMYQLGPGEDAPKACMTPGESSARWRAKRRHVDMVRATASTQAATRQSV